MADFFNLFFRMDASAAIADFGQLAVKAGQFGDVAAKAEGAAKGAMDAAASGARSAGAEVTGLSSTAQRLAEQYAQVANVFLTVNAGAKDFARAGANAAQVAQLTGASTAEARAAVEAYGKSAAVTSEDILMLKAAQEQLAAAGMAPVAEETAKAAGLLEMLGGNASHGSLGVSYLRRELISVAASATSTNPILARLGFTLAAMHGAGTGAITAIVGIAAAVLVFKGVSAIYEKVNADAIANQKAFDDWAKSGQGLAAEADGDRRAMEALSGTIAAGTIVVHGATKAQEDLRQSLAGTHADLSSGVTTWGRLKDAVSGFFHDAGGGAAGSLVSPGTKVLESIHSLESAYGDGKVSIDQYRASLTLLAQSYPDFSKEIQQAEQLGSALQAQRREQQALTAAQAQRSVTANAEGPMGFAASDVQKVRDLKAEYAALASGGIAAANAVKQHSSAMEKARSLYADFISKTLDASNATATDAQRMVAAQAAHVSFANALKLTSGPLADMVHNIVSLADAETLLPAKIDAAKKALDDASKAQQKNLDDFHSFMDARTADYAKSQKAQADFTAGVAANVEKIRAETGGLDRENAVVGQSQAVRDALAVTLASEAAVRELVASAQAKGTTVTQDEIDTVSRVAAAHEAATIRLREHQQAVAAATKSDARAYKDEARDVMQTARQLSNAVGSTFESFMMNVLTSGKDIWKSLMADIERQFLRLIAKLAEQDIMKKILSNSLSPTAVAAMAGTPGMGFVAPQSGPSSGATFMGGAGVGMAGLGVGYGVGSQTTNSALGALGGAASGAAAGAMLGSVVPGIGTAVGAVIGGITGLVGGLFGSAAKAREAAKQMEAARQTFTTAFSGLVGTLNDNQLQAGIAQVQQQFDNLRKQAQAAYKGSDLEYQLARIGTLQGAYVQKLRDQYAEQQNQITQSLQVRQLQAQLVGLTGDQARALANQIAVTSQAAQQEAALASARSSGDSAQNILLLQQTQAMEKAALELQLKLAAQAQAFAVEQARGAIQVRMLAANGYSDQAALLQLQLQHAKEYNDAVLAGMNAQYLAALKTADAAEQAKLQADQAATAIQNAMSHLNQQFQVFGTSPQDQLKAIAQLYGFSGMTKDQVLAKYTSYSPGETLTAKQQETNAAIAQWLQTYGSIAGGSSSPAGGGSAPTSNLSTSVTQMSIAQGENVGGMLTSANIWLAEIAQNTRSLRMGAGGYNVPVGGTLPNVGGGVTVLQIVLKSDSALSPGQQAAPIIDNMLATRQSTVKAAAGLPRTL